MSAPWPDLGDLQRSVLAAPADGASSSVTRWVAGQVGGSVALRLADRAGRELHPVASSGDVRDLEAWSLEAGPAAQALWTRTVARVPAEGHTLVHVPVVARGTVHGVLSLDPGADGATTAEVADDAHWYRLGEAVAMLLTQADRVTDAQEVRRRSSSFSVSAELQWQLLPPTSVADEGVELHALVEPAPRMSSDLFDWSLDDGRSWLAVLDAEGRNLSAALPASVALAALRHARRCRLPIEDQVSLADQAVYDEFRGQVVVRALVMSIDLRRRAAQMIGAGDPDGMPRALRRREGRVEEIAVTVHEDLGRFDRSHYRADALDLAAADDLLVVSDGGPGAHDGEGALGMEAVAEHFAAMRVASAHPRRLLDRIRAHSGGELAQDATALVVSLIG